MPIARYHRRGDFDCGNRDLNAYLARHARQNHRSGVSKTFIAEAQSDSGCVLGYYSICPGQLEFTKVPRAVTRRLAQYPVPVFRIARLAVHLGYQGQGLGGELLLAAGQRAIAVAQETGGFALAIDAKDDRAAGWYARFGAIPLLDEPLTLILPLATVQAALGGLDVIS